MVTFLDRLRKVFFDLAASQPAEANVAHNPVSALAMILVEVIRVDGRIKTIETDHLAARMTEHLGLSAKEATALVSSTVQAKKAKFDLDELATELRRGVSLEDRRKLVALAWDIAASDGEVHEFEEGFVVRLGRLVGFGEAEVLMLRPAFGEVARHDG